MRTTKEDPVLVITELTKESYSKIIDYLASSPSSTVYHHPFWIKILAAETNQKYIYLVYTEKDRITGLLPLLFTRGIPLINSPLCKRRISSLPRTPFAGILADNEFVYCRILEKVKEISFKYPGTLIQLKSDKDYSLIDKSFKSAEWRSNYIKKIPTGNEELTFASKKDEKDIYRALKRARERNVFIKKGESLDELKIWYRLYLIIMRQKRVPPRKFSFFESMWNFLRPAGLLDVNYAVIKESGKDIIINGNINFTFNQKYFGGFKAGNGKFSSYMGGDLIMYTELQELKKKGYSSYDVGEVSEGNKTLDKYKTKWGVEKFRIYHNYYGSINHESLYNLDNFAGKGVISKAWNKLPLNVTAKLGNIVNYYL